MIRLVVLTLVGLFGAMVIWGTDDTEAVASASSGVIVASAIELEIAEPEPAPVELAPVEPAPVVVTTLLSPDAQDPAEPELLPQADIEVAKLENLDLTGVRNEAVVLPAPDVPQAPAPEVPEVAEVQQTRPNLPQNAPERAPEQPEIAQNAPLESGIEAPILSLNDITLDATGDENLGGGEVFAALSEALGDPLKINDPAANAPANAVSDALNEALAPAAPAPSPIVMEVTGSAVNLRAGPSTTQAVLGRMLRGDRVELLAEMADNWMQIRDVVTGDVGYMSGDFLQVVPQ